MKPIAMLLLACASLPAAVPLSTHDEAEIRIAIDEWAKLENSKDTGEVWTERGPAVYRIRTIEGITREVALVDATGGRTGPFPDVGKVLFVMLRDVRAWKVVRKARVAGPKGPLLIPATP